MVLRVYREAYRTLDMRTLSAERLILDTMNFFVC